MGLHLHMQRYSKFCVHNLKGLLYPLNSIALPLLCITFTFGRVYAAVKKIIIGSAYEGLIQTNKSIDKEASAPPIH